MPRKSLKPRKMRTICVALTPHEFGAAIRSASSRGVLELECKQATRSGGHRWVRLKATLTHCRYGGYHWDRIAERNAITAMFGFERKPEHCWSLDVKSISVGWWLANVIADYGEDNWIRIDGRRIALLNDCSYHRGTYISLDPFETNTRTRRARTSPIGTGREANRRKGG